VAEGGVDPAPVAESPVEEGEGLESAAIVEPPEAAAEQLQAQLDELQDRHLRTAAEYDNFRKRTAKERSEMWQRAQADVVANILDALDDFGRVLDVDPATASAGDVIKGVELVERKLLRELEIAGLERVGQVGEPFDPNHHEAIGSVPAEFEEQDHTVGTIVQIGYRYGGTLIRPARVQVMMWTGDESEGPS
jgi:molecular chaperone GrpE